MRDFRTLKKMFNPDRRKILLAIVTSYAYLLLTVLLSTQDNVLLIAGPLPLMSVLLLSLLDALIYFPFACGVVLFYDSFTENRFKALKENKITLCLAFLCTFLLNPFTLRVLATLPYVLSIVSQGALPYGSQSIDAQILIDRVYTDSPAEQAGLKPGMVIMKLNEQVVRSLDEFKSVVLNIGSGKLLNITTSDDNRFSLLVGSSWPKIGIVVRFGTEKFGI